MFEVELDKSKNLLRVIFRDHVTADQAKESTERVAILLPETKTGFRLLTDLTGLELMDNGCVPFIKRSMDLCNKQGVAAIVRVIPDPRKDVGFNILSLFHYRHGTQIVTCQTLEEAMQVLAG